MQGPRPSKMWSLHASKLRYLITRWHSATSQKNEFLDYTDVTPQNAYMYSSCSKSSSVLPSSFVCFSLKISYFCPISFDHYILYPSFHNIIPHQSSYVHSTLIILCSLSLSLSIPLFLNTMFFALSSSHYSSPSTLFSFSLFIPELSSLLYILRFCTSLPLSTPFRSGHSILISPPLQIREHKFSFPTVRLKLYCQHKSEMKSRNITTTWRWGSVIPHWVITFIVSWEMRIRNITPPLYIIEQPPNSANVTANMLLRPHLNFTTFSIEKIHNLVGSAPPLSYLASYTPY